MSKRENNVTRSPSNSTRILANVSSASVSDFVMTISDSDTDIPDLDEDEDLPSDTGDIHKPVSLQPEGISRRRKKRKRSEEEEAVQETKDVGELDSDFEFEVGAFRDGAEDFEGWGFEGLKEAMKDSKRGVDIDEIIRRRRKDVDIEGDRLEISTEKGEGAQVDTESASDSDELKKDGKMNFAGFERDVEALGEDGFGMGADSDEESSKENKPSSQASETEADDVSESESVAEYIPHPDDVASSSDSEDVEDATEDARKAAYFAPIENDNGTASTNFQTMNLSRPILRGLASVGFTAPTPIQQKTIPVALLGKDVVGGAVTGSGKTAAFIVPILERLLYRPKKVPTSRVLILCPTRELAIQCHDVARKLAQYTDIQFSLTVGGLSLKVQEAQLKKRPDVIIATPGRFIDHMRNSQGFVVDTIEIIVMDEADRMLEDGFADELNEIVNTIPKSRQTMLFSATMTDSVDKLIRLSLQRPVRLMVDSRKSTVKTLVQEFVRIRPQREDTRLAILVHVCKEVVENRCIVFFRSKVFAHRMRVVFGLFGLKAAELHGSLTQEQRVKAVENLRDGKVDFLLATDLASRGLDIKNVSTVINYEAPQSYAIYQHRVGRTARAGKQGRAITLAAEADRKVVKSAIKAANDQNSKVVSRVLDQDFVDKVAAKINNMQEDIESILKEEKEEKAIREMEMQIRRGENLIKHEDEIASRPRRTWFETQREKGEREKIGKAELNGILLPGKKEKLSGKKRKREESKAEGTSRKKKKEERGVKTFGKKGPKGKGTKGRKPTAKSKPRKR